MRARFSSAGIGRAAPLTLPFPPGQRGEREFSSGTGWFALKRAIDLALEADDAAGAGIGDEPHLAALARLEPGSGAGRDVEAKAARLLAVELQRRVGLVEMVVRADLDRPVAGVGDGQGHGRSPGVQLDINSIGHNADNCRRGYVAQLKAAFEKVKDKLGADSQRRIETNPLRVLDSKLEHEQPIIETLPRIADHLCDDCKAHYAAVKRQLEMRGVLYRENWRLVRGLDYYMRTTFEITAQGLGSQNAVCGGGRYDGLVELLGGPPTKGIGFAIGEDRLILSLQAAQNQSPVTSRQSLDVFIAWMGEHAQATAIRAAKDLRNAGFSVELPPIEQKFGKALERASKLNSLYALILGDNEVAEGSWTLKTLADGSQRKFTEPALLDFLKDSRD